MSGRTYLLYSVFFIWDAQVVTGLEDPLKIVILSDDKKTKIKVNTPSEYTSWLKALQYCTTSVTFQNIVTEEHPDTETLCINDDNETIYSRANSSQFDQCIGNINEATDSSVSPSYICVCTIDFGTTYSTWAFSFISDYKRDPTTCHVKHWTAGGASTLLSEKCPTTVLVKPDGKTIEAFGYEAENTYYEMVSNNTHRQYFFFTRFKMVLYRTLGETLHRDMKIRDINGRSLRALDLVSMTIKYLKDDMQREVDNKVQTLIPERQTKWVLTVPAIWTDGAKQFMREAGIQAGIASERLSLALEPEAASILWKHIPVDSNGTAGLPVGAKYLVLDAGGGTIDVTIHEVEKDDRLKEVLAPCGGPWGGTTVDGAFETLLINVLGDDVVRTFQENHMDDWIDFWRTFEMKKRDFGQLGTEKDVTIRMPVSLSETYVDKKKSTLSIGIANGPYKSDISAGKDKLHFNPNLIRDLYNESIIKTLDLLTKLKREHYFETILMVGGFSESKLLQNAIKHAFCDGNIIVPNGASTAIVKGALIWGHMPRVISQRVLKYTYGTGTVSSIESDDENHQDCDRKRRDGYLYCHDTFRKHVEKGQEIKFGEKLTRKYVALEPYQQEIYIAVYASDKTDPRHVFDIGCKRLGELIVRLRQPAEDPNSVRVLVHFSFSGTELVVDGEEEGSDQIMTVTLNCLD